MRKYQVRSGSGSLLGTVEAASPQEAVLAFLLSEGYDDIEKAQELAKSFSGVVVEVSDARNSDDS